MIHLDAALSNRKATVTHEDEVRSGIDAAAAHFGRLDILVNNAGISGVNKPTHEITEEEWDRVQLVIDGGYTAR